MNHLISSPQSGDMQNLVARNSYQDTQLCHRCKDLDVERKLNSALDRLDKSNLHISLSIHNYKSHDQGFGFEMEIDRGNSDPACTLCKLLAMAGSEYDAQFTITDDSSDRVDLLVLELPDDAPTSGPVIHKFHVVPFVSAFVQIWSLDPAKANLGVLRAKFEYCKAHHFYECRPARVPVEHFRVFNCATKMLEDATIETEYAALSYVWGSPDTSDEYPQTIRDAIEVAQAFGLKYIWVDQLCIDQEGSHKAEQIRQMHHIYSNAELTIVAAAGCDSRYGIPGVHRTRHEQGNFKIGSLRFREMYIFPPEDLERTTWIKRGWTYQERYFSNRRLTFTDRQAWFSCQKCDSISGCERFPDDFGLDVDDDGSPRPNLNKQMSMFDMITDYSRRSLTHETDVINAFSGCLEGFKQANPPTYHLWGSPILLYDQGLPSGLLDGFLVGLQWMLPEFPKPLRRRMDFPSWSWTGWIGPVQMYRPQRISELTNLVELSVALELTTGELLGWSELEKSSFLKGQPDLLSRFILLSGWTMPVRLELSQSYDSSELSLHAVVKAKGGEERASPAVLLTEGNRNPSKERMAVLEKKMFTGILLTSVMEHAYIMLMSEMGGYYERVGYIYVPFRPLRNESETITRRREINRWQLLELRRAEVRLG